MEKVFVRVFKCKMGRDCFFDSFFFSTTFFELSPPFVLAVVVLFWWIVVIRLIGFINEPTMALAELIIY